MQYMTLNNGVQMPMVGFGTWQIRGETGKRAILTALEVGYRLLDTARMYDNEAIVGAAIRESGLPRREIFLTTKLYRPSASYEKARADIEDSLARLQTDYVDLLLLHEPYEAAPAMYRALEEACRGGKVRAIGVSNFGVRDYEAFVGGCAIVPAVDQVESHVYHPRFALQAVLARRGTRMQGWAPFTEGRRPIFTEPVLVELGRKYGKTAGQVALRYLVQNGVGVIPKSVHRDRMRENLALFDFTLTPADQEAIRALDGGRSLFGWD